MSRCRERAVCEIELYICCVLAHSNILFLIPDHLYNKVNKSNIDDAAKEQRMEEFWTYMRQKIGDVRRKLKKKIKN